MTLPFYGKYCVGDLTVHIGNYAIDPLHPGVITTIMLASVLYVFIFKNPT